MWFAKKTNPQGEIFSWPLILQWAAFYGALFLLGAGARIATPFLYLTALLWFLSIKNYENALYTILFWIFFNGFYQGQGYFSENFSAQITKITFLLLIAFFIYHGRYNKNIFSYNLRSGFVGITVVYLFLLLISLFVNRYPVLRILNFFSFLFLFFAFTEFRLSNTFYRNIINILPAIGVIQIPIAIMQFKGIIAPPSRVSYNMVWVASLDDAASGTFGPAMSPDLSWYLSFMTLFVFSYGIIKRSWWIAGSAFLFMIQYMVVDSKTALVATVLLFIIFFSRAMMHSNRLKISINYILSAILIFATFGTVFFFAWKSYYKTLEEQTNIRSFETVGNMYSGSYDLITRNFLMWGKISGYYYVSQMQFEENPVKFFIGFGPGEYNYKTPDSRGYRIRAKLPRIIQGNNGLNARSGMITHFAETGIIGTLLILSYFVMLFRFYKKLNPLTDMGRNMKIILGPYLSATFIYFIIYMNGFTSISIYAFWILNAAIIGLEQNAYLQKQQVTLENTPPYGKTYSLDC